jgi:predicted ribosome quality control (RQC) complex YloA/Tae2 family protein
MITETCSCNDTDYIIQIGKNAVKNSQLVDISNNTDIWFHVKDLPSCHVVLKNDSPKMKTIPKQIIKRCAYLCKENSSCKNTKNITIIYTFISNVTQTDIVGQVIATNVKSIII